MSVLIVSTSDGFTVVDNGPYSDMEFKLLEMSRMMVQKGFNTEITRDTGRCLVHKISDDDGYVQDLIVCDGVAADIVVANEKSQPKG